MKEALEKFDIYLNEKNLPFECIVIGGAALIQLGIVDRRTLDVDLLDPTIPKLIKEASVNFAKENLSLQLSPEEWFNSGPESLKRDLPKLWRTRLVKMLDGSALTIWTLGRSDLLKTKLFACADRDQDFEDCIALAPTKLELAEAIKWVKERDANPNWGERVEGVFTRIAKELGHE